MFRRLHRYVIRKRFERLVRPYDDAIAQARLAHRPTRQLEAAKRAFVNNLLAGARR